MVNFGCKSVQTSPKPVVNPVRSEPVFSPVKNLTSPKLTKSVENSATLPNSNEILPENSSPLDFFNSPLPPLEPKTTTEPALTLDELLNQPVFDFETPLEPPKPIKTRKTPEVLKSPQAPAFPEPNFSEIDQVLGISPRKPEAPKVKFFVFDESISKEKWYAKVFFRSKISNFGTKIDNLSPQL